MLAHLYHLNNFNNFLFNQCLPINFITGVWLSECQNLLPIFLFLIRLLWLLVLILSHINRVLCRVERGLFSRINLILNPPYRRVKLIEVNLPVHGHDLAILRIPLPSPFLIIPFAVATWLLAMSSTLIGATVAATPTLRLLLLLLFEFLPLLLVGLPMWKLLGGHGRVHHVNTLARCGRGAATTTWFAVASMGYWVGSGELTLRLRCHAWTTTSFVEFRNKWLRVHIEIAFGRLWLRIGLIVQITLVYGVE